MYDKDLATIHERMGKHVLEEWPGVPLAQCTGCGAFMVPLAFASSRWRLARRVDFTRGPGNHHAPSRRYINPVILYTTRWERPDLNWLIRLIAYLKEIGWADHNPKLAAWRDMVCAGKLEEAYKEAKVLIHSAVKAGHPSGTPGISYKDALRHQMGTGGITNR